MGPTFLFFDSWGFYIEYIIGKNVVARGSRFFGLIFTSLNNHIILFEEQISDKLLSILDQNILVG